MIEGKYRFDGILVKRSLLFFNKKFDHIQKVIDIVGSANLSEIFSTPYRIIPQQTVYRFKKYRKIKEKPFLPKILAFLTLIFPVARSVPYHKI
jgi:hypothetical protein